MKIKFDWVLFFSILTATFIGIITLYTQDYYVDEPSNRWLKQTIFLIPALLLFYFFYRINYNTLGLYSLPLYGISILLLIITLIPFIGSEIKGARSWIRIGPIGLQTSEFAKFAAILILAKYLELKEREMNQLTSLFLPSILFVIPMLLIVIQPDLGGAIIFAPILLSMLFIGGADILHITSIIMFFSTSLLVPLYIEYHNIILIDYVIERLSSLDKVDLIPAINILKSNIWVYLEKMSIPNNVFQTDADYLQKLLQNSALFTELKQIAFSVRYEEGGFLLKILDNDLILLLISIIFLVIAFILLVIRFTQGTIYKNLRKYYIPLGVLGISILSAYLIHNTFSFKYHQVIRVTAFINPERFPRDLAYQIRASKAAIGSGEFIGKGLYKAEMTTGLNPLLPEAFTDFIFASWAERTGFIGSTLLILALSLIIIRGFFIAYIAKDRFGSLLASGISFLFLYHIILNIGIELGLLPVTGLPLSFVSYGGSHLVLCYSLAGILESIYSRKYTN